LAQTHYDRIAYRYEKREKCFAEAVVPQGAPSGTENHVVSFELQFPTQLTPPTINGKLINVSYKLNYRCSVSMACAATASLPLLVGTSSNMEPAHPDPVYERLEFDQPRIGGDQKLWNEWTRLKYQ
jgi:hypothetical protein